MVLKEFFSFLTDPIKAKRNFSFFDLFLLMAFQVLFAILLQNIFESLFKQKALQGHAEFSLQWAFLLLMIFGPVKEEIKYRLGLGDFNFRNIFVSISVFFFDAIFLLLLWPMEGITPTLIYVFGLSSIVFFFILFLYPLSARYYANEVEAFYSKYYIFIFYSSAFFFALSHVYLSGQSKSNNELTVFAMHFISAIFFSFVRINCGIVVAITYHFVNNLPTFLFWLWFLLRE